jgi:hypothetical protein
MRPKQPGFAGNPNPYLNLDGMTDREILEIAFESGYIPNQIKANDTAIVPGWLAEILVKRGLVALED